MDVIMLPVDPNYKSQAFTVDIQPDGIPQTYRVEIRYRPYVGKYFATVTDAETGEDVLRNFPLIASVESGLNDLLKQVTYKLCGSLVCYPLQKEPTYQNPNGTISEYELLWGDNLWKS